MAKLVKERQPKLYEYVMSIRSKRTVQARIDVTHMKPFLHVSSKYPTELGNSAVVAPLMWHTVNKNAVIVWDLRVDPTPLLDLSVEELRARLYTAHETLRAQGEAPLALKLVHTNRCPIVAPAGMLNTEEAARLQISGDLCRKHLAVLRTWSELGAKLTALYAEDNHPAENDPDHMLYSGGFFSDTDRRLMEQVRNASVDELAELDLPFQDSRLEEMLMRYKARNFPQAMTPEEHQRWEEYRQFKLLSAEAGSEGYLTLPKFFDQLNYLAQHEGITPQQTELLQELAFYGESIYPMAY